MSLQRIGVNVTPVRLGCGLPGERRSIGLGSSDPFDGVIGLRRCAATYERTS
jgi:hypothetical protein